MRHGQAISGRESHHLLPGSDATEVHDSARTISSREAAIRFYLNAALSENTQRAYQSDLRAVSDWGATFPIGAIELASYLSDQAAWLSPYTLTRRMSAVRRAHVGMGQPDPTAHPLVRNVLAGIWRTHGRPQRRARALSMNEIETMLPLMLGLRGLRDRALTLLAFRAALRRSELVGINVEDLGFSHDGLLLHIRRSKSDQRSLGRIVAVPYAVSEVCAVRALQHWLAESHVEAGPVFQSISRAGQLKGRLSAQSVGLIVKAYAKTVGLEECGLSAHSLRAGFVTAAINAGASVHAIQRQTGHKSIETLYKYVRTGNPFLGNANKGID